MLPKLLEHLKPIKIFALHNHCAFITNNKINYNDFPLGDLSPYNNNGRNDENGNLVSGYIARDGNNWIDNPVFIEFIYYFTSLFMIDNGDLLNVNEDTAESIIEAHK